MNGLRLTLALAVLAPLAPAYGEGTPSGTVVENGADRGVPGIADSPGDCVLTYTCGGRHAAASNLVKSRISPAYDLSALPEPPDISRAPGDAAFYPYSLTNRANCPDTISFEVVRSEGEEWQAALLLDNGAGGAVADDGIHQAGETDILPPAVPLASGQTLHFFLRVSIPPDAPDHSFFAGVLIARNQNGSGADDGWPGAGASDTRSDPTMTRCIHQAAVTVDCVEPEVVGRGGAAAVCWTANKDADFRVELGGSGIEGSGALLAQGTCRAGVQVRTQVAEKDLPDNARSALFVIISCADGAAFASCKLTDDQAAPSIVLRRIVVTGRVTDLTVREIRANGQPFPVVDASYSFAVEAPVGTEIVIEATNILGRTRTRVVRVQ